MKLLVENIDPQNMENIIEESEGKKNFYISGPMILSEIKNNNGRIYPSHIIEREVNILKEKIKNNKAAGELSHPQSPEVNLERISHYIQEMKQDGNVWIGKAKVASTPMGNIVKNLITDGYKLGVSTRGLGTVGSNGIVDESFKLVCIDIVDNPSIGKYLDPIVESIRYKMLDDGSIIKDLEPALTVFENKISTLPKANVEKYLMDAVQNFLRTVK